MDAKEYLQQAKQIDRIVKSKSEQLARLEALAVSATPIISETGSVCHHDDSKGSKLENQILGIIELKESILRKTEELIRIRKEITITIDSINSLTHQYILEERYLNYLSWDTMVDATGFSKDYLFRLHRDGLKMVQVIIDAFAIPSHK